MTCMVCPPESCLELRFVTPDDKNVADIVLHDTSELGTREIPVGEVEVGIGGHWETSRPRTLKFMPGEQSLIVHKISSIPTLLTFQFFPQKDAQKDAQEWGPIKRGAVQIGNEDFQKNPKMSPQHTHVCCVPSIAEANAKKKGWGFVSTTYAELTPSSQLDVSQMMSERKKGGNNYKFPTTEKDLKRFFVNRGQGYISLTHAKHQTCTLCGTTIYRLVIELRGLTCLKPRLHIVENLDNKEFQGATYTTGSGFIRVNPRTHHFFEDKHVDNAFNLASFSALAYATLELSGDGKSEMGSIYNVFRKFSCGSVPQFADTINVRWFLECRPYSEHYLLENIEYFYNKSCDAEGFAASDANNIIIGFRGTVSGWDWATDLTFLLEPYSGVLPSPDMCVHVGFRLSVEALRAKVLEYCRRHGATRKNIFVCGHSLGGAIATIVALILQKEYKKEVMLYTYGSPRVGNTAFIRYMLEHNVVHYRYVNHSDAVAMIPLVGPVNIFSRGYVFLKALVGHDMVGSDFLPAIYRHHGNFCHIVEYHNYTWVLLRLGQKTLVKAFNKAKDMDTEAISGDSFISFTEHPIHEYIISMSAALANKFSVLRVEEVEAQKSEARIAKERFSLQP